MQRVELLFRTRLKKTATDVEHLLGALLSDKRIPTRLRNAMRHGSLHGGKRFRPFLVVESAVLFGVPRKRALQVGVALECVHSYSLIHDDLPAMDDDALRRGRPTVHKAYDDATAILAGDSLITLAFELLARKATHPDAAIRAQLVLELARAAGASGMAGGQMLDLEAEGRYARQPKRFSREHVRKLQSMKTGALVRFACIAGAILGSASRKELSALERYGSCLGEAFQIADDLLDLAGDPRKVGKKIGKDAAAHKATFIATLGEKKARKRLDELVAKAEASLVPFGKRTDVLKEAARFAAARDY